MRARGNGVMRIAVPIKAWVQRFAFVLLIGTAVALLALSRADIAVTERARAVLVDVVTPLLDVLARPVQTAKRVYTAAEDLFHLQSENIRLREENARLLHWQEVARRLEVENTHLRKFLNVRGEARLGFVTARVVGDAGGPFVRTMLITAGQNDGVRRGDAVMGDNGFVGRVLEAGLRASRILLITDLNSRIPVLIESSRHRGILSGDNSLLPKLDYLPSSAQVAVGDRILTSGDGGNLPPDLPIGEVISTQDGILRVKPLVDLSRLEAVRVVRFDPPKPEISTRFGGQR